MDKPYTAQATFKLVLADKNTECALVSAEFVQCYTIIF